MAEELVEDLHVHCDYIVSNTKDILNHSIKGRTGEG